MLIDYCKRNEKSQLAIKKSLKGATVEENFVKKRKE